MHRFVIMLRGLEALRSKFERAGYWDPTLFPCDLDPAWSEVVASIDHLIGVCRTALDPTRKATRPKG